LPPQFVTCQDDGEAEHEARKLLAGRALEIWCGARKVGLLKLRLSDADSERVPRQRAVP